MISVIKSIANAILGQSSLPSHTCLFYRDTGYSVGAVEMDLILNEHHEQNAEVTEHPMQEGRAVTDGIYVELREGTLTGLISNHSMNLAQQHAKQLTTMTADSILDEAKNYKLENRAEEAWKKLLAIQKAGELVTIVTALETYNDVAITKIATDRDGDTGDSLEILVTFKQINKVKLTEDKVTAQVQPEDMDSDINRSAAVGVNGGQTVGGEPTEAQKSELVKGVIK